MFFNRLEKKKGETVVSQRELAAAGGKTPPVDSILGVVASVHGEAEDGFVSVSLLTATEEVPEGTHITFSLPDWKGSTLPRKGQVVRLEEVSLFEKGWRALSAKPIQLKKTEKGDSR